MREKGRRFEIFSRFRTEYLSSVHVAEVVTRKISLQIHAGRLAQSRIHEN